MKVIVFGGSGFLGSHVADELVNEGHAVTVYDTKESQYLKKEMKFISGDITDLESVKKAISGNDYVYNFAGLADIGKASQKPVESVRVNILGNTNILEASKINRVKRFLFASTLYVYGEAGSFYRCSKQACELIIEEYQRKFNLDYTILRFGSLYGLRADDTNWIYSVLKKALFDGKIVRYGDGQEIREYVHVQDAAKCSIEALSDEYKNQSVIISGNQQIKVKDLLVMIKEIMRNKIKVEYLPADKDPLHYEITPYIFKPNLAKKMICKNYVELGQGILQVLSDIYGKEYPHKKHIGICIDE